MNVVTPEQRRRRMRELNMYNRPFQQAYRPRPKARKLDQGVLDDLIITATLLLIIVLAAIAGRGGV